MSAEDPNSIVLGGRRMHYAIRYSQKAKKCRIRVSPAGIEVILPESSPPGKGPSFLRQNASWVEAQVNFLRRFGPIRDVPGNELHAVLVRGETKRLEIV